MSKAHVPPRASGNTNVVLRAPDIVLNGVRQPGRWTAGGMWVRGLCQDCNNRAGNTFDVPYADFARQVERLSTPIASRLAIVPGQAPAASFAPGLVSRSVLFGMFAINPRLRVIFPDLADDLRQDSTRGAGQVRWPDQLSLTMARTHAAFPGQGLLSSGVWSMRVLRERVVHWTFADIVWPPLTWCLVPSDREPERLGLGPPITSGLPDVSEWVKYGPDRTSVDLRNLIPTLPSFAHPMLNRTDDWVEFMTSDGSDGDAVIVFGKAP
ncbi:hypothetical protein [Terrabacter ginsenosidimutans]